VTVHVHAWDGSGSSTGQAGLVVNGHLWGMYLVLGMVACLLVSTLHDHVKGLCPDASDFVWHVDVVGGLRATANLLAAAPFFCCSQCQKGLVQAPSLPTWLP
jgi:hypothetical protein